MGLNNRFKTPITFLSVVTIAIFTVAFTIMVMNHEHIETSAAALFLFALIFFGPVSLLYLVLNSGWPITVEAVVLLTATPSLLLAATFWRSRYSVMLRRVGWFFWVVCSLMVAGFFI
jgi:hypothetical protein